MCGCSHLVYIEHELIKPHSLERRDYQLNMASSCIEQNTLVVLPTGMGKTVIATIVIANILKKMDGKILFLAPTKPLVEQHAGFLKENLLIEKIAISTGEIPPKKRKKIWDEARIVVSTPQVIENDILSKRMELEEVAFIIFDEAHRATGKYSYAFIGEKYEGKVMGMTASPGNNLGKISEVCRNLGIRQIEARTEKDKDVHPFVHRLEFKWEIIELPPDFSRIIKSLKMALSERINKLYKMGFLPARNPTKKELLDAQLIIRERIREIPSPPKFLYHMASVQAAAIKIEHALELIETQGIEAFNKYLNRLRKASGKASRNLLKDERVIEAMLRGKHSKIEHPKIKKVVEMAKNEIDDNKQLIIFTHYRDTSKKMVRELSNAGMKVARFIGQASKLEDKGLSQKEQVKIIREFREKKYDALVATSVAEEGLDIPSIDTVIFYEPVPSEIRSIQRKGRTARKKPGKVIILITKGTRDEGYYWSARKKEREMRKAISFLKSRSLERGFEIEGNKNEMDEITDTKKIKEKTKDEIKIFIDQRELRSLVARNLFDRGIEVSPKHLEVGDYIIGNRIGIERKVAPDFSASLIDNRLFSQVKRLKDAYPSPLIIIEGEGLFSRDIDQKAIYGAIASIIADFGISIITTRDAKETADLLIAMAIREQKERREIKLRGKKVAMSLDDQRRFIVEGLPNVSAVLAKRLLEHFESIKRIANASMEKLMEVKGIGKNIASKIFEVINEEWEEE